MGKNIFTSSIGRKLIMSITGAFLVLFLAFHGIMNLVLVFDAESYNAICEFLGSNWYAIIGTAVLAGGMGLHILYAGILTLMNFRARGKNRYAISKNEKGVSWASKNMFILGGVVFLGLGVHLYNFWWNMQFAELQGLHLNQYGKSPTDGAWLVQNLFSDPIYVGIYLVWLGALWLHLTHGFWSMFQSAGISNEKWLKRVKFISYGVSTLLVGMFVFVIVALYVRSLM